MQYINYLKVMIQGSNKKKIPKVVSWTQGLLEETIPALC